MTANYELNNVNQAEHQPGKFLRLQTPGTNAMELAMELLGTLESELHAQVENSGWKQGYGLEVSVPLLVQLESLEVEIGTDGEEVVLARVGGSSFEFDELCNFLKEHMDGVQDAT